MNDRKQDSWMASCLKLLLQLLLENQKVFDYFCTLPGRDFKSARWYDWVENVFFTRYKETNRNFTYEQSDIQEITDLLS